MKQIILNLLYKSPKLYQLVRGGLTQDKQKQLVAKVLINQLRERGRLKDIQEAEFSVYSQFGDDGIIQYLIQAIKLNKNEHNFIEIGVEDYTEANTRFLLTNDNWSGVVIDATKQQVDFIKQDDIYWKHDLTAICSFVTKKNVNRLIKDNCGNKKIGLLSIDIDGNDYWIWQQIEVIDPVMVIMEYNGLFGADRSVSIPYKETFSRMGAHYSGLYWGCSLKALVELGAKKGYVLVGTNRAGNNAYFVRKDRVGKVRKVSLKEGFTEPKYRESRDKQGRLSFIGGDDRLRLIEALKVYDFTAKKIRKIRDVFFN